MRSPLYALLYRAGTMTCQTNARQLPVGCSFSQSLLVELSTARRCSFSAGVFATSKGHIDPILATHYSHLTLSLFYIIFGHLNQLKYNKYR